MDLAVPASKTSVAATSQSAAPPPPPLHSGMLFLGDSGDHGVGDLQPLFSSESPAGTEAAEAMTEARRGGRSILD